jgi:hypothetical protein
MEARAMIGMHLINFTPVTRPSGKVLGTASIAIGDDISITAPVSLSNNGITIGSPSKHALKGNLCISGRVFPNHEIRFPNKDYNELTNRVISELRGSYP